MKYTIKQLYIFKIINWILFTFFSIVVPITLISEKYKLFEKASKYKSTAAGMIAIIIVFFYILGQIIKILFSIKNVKIRAIIRGVIRVAPIFLVFISLQFAMIEIKKMFWIVTWSMISNIVAIIFDVLFEIFNEEIQLYHEAKKQNKIDRIKGMLP